MTDATVFVLAAAALLGSPGPGIAALAAVGRARGLSKGLPYLAAMQAGLALAAGLSAAGLATLMTSVPWIRSVLTFLFTAYLVWLAWSVASAPVGDKAGDAGRSERFPLSGAFLLGVANPKAYLAFAALFGSFAVTEPAQGWQDTLIKWGLVLAVTVVVDLAWLLFGAAIGRVDVVPGLERVLNIAMGAVLLTACILSLL